MATPSADVARSLRLLLDLLRDMPRTAPEIDGEVRRRWRLGELDFDDRATRALTLPAPLDGPGMGLLRDRLRRLHRAGLVAKLAMPHVSRSPLWMSADR